MRRSSTVRDDRDGLLLEDTVVLALVTSFFVLIKLKNNKYFKSNQTAQEMKHTVLKKYVNTHGDTTKLITLLAGQLKAEVMPKSLLLF